LPGQTPKENPLRFDTAQDAEQAFYRAFATADFELLKSVWASQEIACVHPGGALILESQAVLESWSRILSGQGAMNLRVEVLYRLTQEKQVVHVVRERFGSVPGDEARAVFATNVYRKGMGGWRMHLHHASIEAPVIHNQPRVSVH
jgi:hypothetical protein